MVDAFVAPGTYPIGGVKDGLSALKQGYNLPKAGLGLLFVIFMDLLPAVSKERRRLVWSLGVFFGLGLISALMLEIFGSH